MFGLLSLFLGAFGDGVCGEVIFCEVVGEGGGHILFVVRGECVGLFFFFFFWIGTRLELVAIGGFDNGESVRPVFVYYIVAE